MPGYTFSYSHITTQLGGSSVFSFSDSDAEAYYNALVTANGGDDIDTQTIYGVSLDNFKLAIDTHVVDLKNDGIWTQLKHYYPYLGGTASTHAINMINATSELTYGGSPSHNNMGVVTDGTTQYIDTGFTLAALSAAGDFTNTDNHFMQFHQNAGGTTWQFGVVDTSRNCFAYSTTTQLTYDNIVAGGARIVAPNTEMSGLMTSTRGDSPETHFAYTNATFKGTAGGSTSAYPLAASNNYSFYFAGRNNSGTPIATTKGNIIQSSLGLYLSGTDVTNFNTAINTLNSSIGRTYTFTDTSASAYWDALTVANGSTIDCPTLYGTTNTAVMEAIDNFYISAKANGYYTKLVRLYPFIGGSDTTHAINAITTGSDLTYTGSPTHDGTGMVTDGVTQYADMENNFSTDVAGVFDYSFGIWMNSTNSTMAMGSRENIGNGAATRWSSGDTILAYVNNLTINIGSAPTEFTKPIIVSTTSNILSKIYLDGSVYGTKTNTKTGVLPSTHTSLIAAWDNYGTGVINRSAGSTKMAFIGDGLTDTEVSNFTNDIKTLNTALGR